MYVLGLLKFLVDAEVLTKFLNVKLMKWLDPFI